MIYLSDVSIEINFLPHTVYSRSMMERSSACTSHRQTTLNTVRFYRCFYRQNRETSSAFRCSVEPDTKLSARCNTQPQKVLKFESLSTGNSVQVVLRGFVTAS